jgi:putative transposase
MQYNPDKHHRRSIRLPGYDYTQEGMYFITIYTWQRECLLGNIVGARPYKVSEILSNIHGNLSQPKAYIELSRYVQVVEYNWQILAEKFSNVRLDKFFIMPNHIHGIIELQSSGGKQLSEIIQNFKTSSARRINQLRDTKGIPVWQRNCYEHIIRNENHCKQFVNI